MKWRNVKVVSAARMVLLLTIAFAPPWAGAQTRVSIGVTETMDTRNPYGDSVALMYGIWCQIYGCLTRYSFDKGDYEGFLAERWEIKDPTTWIFYLRKDAKFHDGRPLTAADVVHSINRIRTDPQSKQKSRVRPIAEAKAISKHIVEIKTKEPFSSLLDFLSNTIITSKDLFEKYGAETADQKYPMGAGPYKLKELVPGQRLVITKNLDYPGMREKAQAPDEVIFRVMRETEQRVTALLNDEIQIAQFIPPHLIGRIEEHPNTEAVGTESVEIMFLAMNPKFKPWDNKLLRKAVAYAIDRDKIIATLLQGRATRLDGPLGPGQYGYDPNLQPTYKYDPEKARELVIQAGFPNGVDVDFYTPVNRYTLDKQIAEAIVPMLRAVGIRAQLKTPEWGTLWARVQKGNIPFFYMGRGSVIDPGRPLAQYFETGNSPRIAYSNRKFDELISLQRQEFDPVKRKKILSEAMSIVTDDAPAHFLWRHQMLYGFSKKVDFEPRPDTYIFADESIRMLR